MILLAVAVGGCRGGSNQPQDDSVFNASPKTVAAVEQLRDEADTLTEERNATRLYQTLQKLYDIEEARASGNEAQVDQILASNNKVITKDDYAFFKDNELSGRELGPHQIALTFDDGPHASFSLKIAAMLKRYNIPAAFFELGERVQIWPKVTQAIAKNGFLIANHSWNHPNLTKFSTARVKSQIESTQEELSKTLGGPSFFESFFQRVFMPQWQEPRDVQAPEFFRCPYGARSRRIVNLIRNENVSQTCVNGECRVNHLNHVMWLIDSLDWADKSPERIVKRVFSMLAMHGDRGVFLMHDIHPQTVKAVELLLPQLVARGYQFVTLYDVLKASERMKIGQPVRVSRNLR